YDRAFQCFREALGEDPKDLAVESMYYRSRFRIVLSRVDDSGSGSLKPIYESIVSEKKNDPGASYRWFQLGRYYCESAGKREKGLDCFEIALALDSGNRELVAYLKALERAKREEEERFAEEEREKLLAFELEREKRRQEELEAATGLLETETVKLRNLEEERKVRELAEQRRRMAEYLKTIDIVEIKPQVFSRHDTTEVQKVQEPEKPSRLEEARRIVDEHLRGSEDLLKMDRVDEVDERLECAFAEILAVDPYDLKALYYRMLLSLKRGSIDAVERAVLLMKSLIKFRHEDAAMERDAKELIDCFLRGVIVQSALQAHNNRERKLLDEKSFRIRLLENRGYLERKDRKLLIEAVTPAGEHLRLEWLLSGNRCGKRSGIYIIGESGLIECQFHGLSPFLKSNVLIEEY
ncbi:MAG: hypothetical protein PHQ23_03910, partial [Candidatus Wallbacteria bacterium]|nr:hypothetical protein [Candidatus Wallbacteria bacterium]